MRLLKTCLPYGSSFHKNYKCSLCGKSRSSSARKYSILDQLICSRPKCGEFKILLANSSNPNVLAIEINHYHYSDPSSKEPHLVNAAELPEGISSTGRVELPGDSTYLSKYRVYIPCRLSTIFEEEPPSVDASTKPSQDFVESCITRRGW